MEQSDFAEVKEGECGMRRAGIHTALPWEEINRNVLLKAVLVSDGERTLEPTAGNNLAFGNQQLSEFK